MNKTKKIIISAVVALCIGNSVVSANTVLPYKLQLSNYLLKGNTLLHSEMDTNKDSNVNVLDLVRYKQGILYPEVTTVTTTVTTTEITTTTPISTTAPVTTTPIVTTMPVTTTQKTTTIIATDPPAIVRKIYITRTGKRYHYDSTCNGGKYFESTLEEALDRGLTPCNKCVH